MKRTGTTDEPTPTDVYSIMPRCFQGPEPKCRGSTESRVIGIRPGRQIWPPCVCPLSKSLKLASADRVPAATIISSARIAFGHSQCVRRLALLCEREIARKNQHRIETALKLAQVPFLRDLTGFDFAAQPSVDPKQIRDLAAARGVSNGENGRTGSKVRYRVDGFAAKAAICSSDAGIVPRINSHAGAVRSGQHAQRLRVRRDEGARLSS